MFKFQKVERILTAGITIAALLFYFKAFIDLNKISKANNFTFNLPVVPVIERKIQNSIPVSYMYVWGFISRDVTHSGPRFNSEKGNLRFVYKEIGGTSCLCMVGNDNYRWELYGVAVRGNLQLAVFYNPTLKSIRVVKPGEELDKGLIVKKIARNEVYVDCCGKIVKLNVFNLRFGGKK